MLASKTKGIFLDADGVLWPEKGAGGILTGQNSAIERLTKFRSELIESEKYKIAVVTNQTLAARNKHPTFKFIKFVNNFFLELKALNLIDDYAVCFHHPAAENILLRRKSCHCRKPKPGMIEKLLAKMDLSPENSILVGDRITDVAAGNTAGIQRNFLIYSEKSLEINQSKNGTSKMPDSIEFTLVENLSEVINYLNER